MERERWGQVEAVFQAAQKRPPDQQAAFLDEACSGDAELRQEVESLLQAATDTRFLESPAAVSDATSPETPSARAGPELLNRLQRGLGSTYQVERELGGGGMARIFVATDATLGRRVVLKVLAPDLAAGLDAERFHREVRLAASLQHPHIVPLHAAGQADGLLYYTMPFVAGESLRQQLEREGPLPVGEVVRLLREVTDALGFAHRRGIIHRDLKPANILLSEGHALVADFGIAKALVASTTTTTGGVSQTSTLTSTGLVLGTPAYMAPEQAASDMSADHRADLYALGCLAYELLTGRPPFQAGSVRGLLTAHLIEPPTPVTVHRPEVPPALASLVMGLLAKEPAQRPQSAAEVLAQLEAVRSDSTPAVPLDPTPLNGSLAPATSDDRAFSPPIPRRRPVLAAVALIILVAGMWLAVRHLTARGGGAPTPVRPVASIAVLPFRNLGPDSQDEYLSDGITEDLINALGRVPELRVVARTSAFTFKGKAEDVRKVGAQLNVAAVMEGSIRKLGDTLRVTAQLVNVADGYQVWSERYERSSADLLALEDDISQAILRVLRPRTGVAFSAPKAGSPTEDPEAYKLYLKGRYHLGKMTEGDYRNALKYFDEAIGLDPTFALAYCGLASAYGALYGTFLPAAEGMPKAKAAGQKCLDLDPSLVEAHALLSGVQMNEWDWPGAEQSFRRTIELDPNHAGVHFGYGWLLVVLGRFDEAATQLNQARQLDPLSLHIEVTAVWPLFYGRRYDEAIDALRKTVSADSSFVGAQFRLAEAYTLKGEFGLAQSRWRAVRALIGDHSDVLGRIGYLYAVSGQRQKAYAIVDTLRARYHKGLSDEPYDIAVVYTGLGEKGKALQWLETAYAERSNWMTFAKVSAELDPLRAEPRFRSLLAKLHLD